MESVTQRIGKGEQTEIRSVQVMLFSNREKKGKAEMSLD